MKWKIMQIDEARRTGPSEVCIMLHFFVLAKFRLEICDKHTSTVLISANFVQILTTIVDCEELKPIRNKEIL